MSVVAKFRVNSVEDWGQSKTLKMTAVYETDPLADPEDLRFTKATPNGKFEMTVDNPGAYEQFTPGDVWYLRMDKAEKAAA